jgi:membrane fusion protein (multidrug efflux system)
MKSRRARTAAVLLLLAVTGLAGSLASWKFVSIQESQAASRNQPEPTETVTVALAQARDYRPTTTSVGTVLALRSIALQNELPGTVERVALRPGDVVEEGTVLVALDVAVERAELAAQQAQAALAETVLKRTQRLIDNRAAAVEDLDRARAERDIALAQVARTQAIIDRKTIRAPFRARVGMADVHPGQYLNEGTLLTTLQGVDDGVHVDFAVEQRVAAALEEGAKVDVFATDAAAPLAATIVAIDARVDPATRNAMVRARIEGAGRVLAPGASVRVQVPVGPERAAVTVPVTALRRGPAGDHIFVLAEDPEGQVRAQVRPVQVGVMLGDEVIIRDGVVAGERVAASGSFKLRDAALVAVANESVASAAGPTVQDF